MSYPILADLDHLVVTTEARKRAITHIVVHHSYTHRGNAASFARNHKEVRKWKDIGYHGVVLNEFGIASGIIELGRDLDNDQDVLEEQGAHVLGMNRHTVGICGVGNFDDTFPDILDPQIRSIGLLVVHLMRICDILLYVDGMPQVIGHREAGLLDNVPTVHKSCPGLKVDCNLMRGFFHEIDKNHYDEFREEYDARIIKLRDEHPEINNFTTGG